MSTRGMGEYEHLYEEMAAEAPSERRPAILLMGRLEIGLNAELRKISSFLETVVNPVGWSHPGWDHFEVRVGDNHGYFICSFKFEFPHPPINKPLADKVKWDRCADRAQNLVLAAIGADTEWCEVESTRRLEARDAAKTEENRDRA